MAPGQDPWLVLGKTLAVFAAKTSPVPGLLPTAEALADLLTSCESTNANRHSTSRVCLECYNLLLAVWKDEVKPPTTQQQAFDDVKETIQDVKNQAATWTQLSWGRAFVRQKHIQEGIEQCKVKISECSMRLQLASDAETSQWQAELSAGARVDREELVAFMCETKNGRVIADEVTKEFGENSIQEVKEIMRMMQQYLAELRKGSSGNEEQAIGLSRNLYELQSRTKIPLPDANLVSGEITGMDTFAVAGTATVDVYRGRYLQQETVAIKVIRVYDGDEDTMRRFLREVRIWEKVWSIDKGRYILPFYGFSWQVGQGRPYMVSPWQENGSALAYVKRHDANLDYRRLIRDIAHGIHVLHCLTDPPVIHGNIQAANILIDAEGNPLLADFGLSKMIEDMTGVPFTQSQGLANLYRWFAPEVIGYGTISLASDVYSFAMTILELLTHTWPYAEYRHTVEIVIRASNGHKPRRPTDERVVERGLDDQLWQLMAECWTCLFSERPGIEKVLEVLTARADDSALVDPHGNAASACTREVPIIPGEE
ncbi:hypothetical protein AAF712_014455 [Marasmius tenuissimus]|uniref:Protein kinase domain-containing protein n=1 Tax=Marasmius tenuissimus TaxID=585030 RepID=A0ABR2ZB26_9AGAR